MKKTKVYITNIENNKGFPGIIYAEVREVVGDGLSISATLNYIFDVLGDKEDMNRRNWDVVNVRQDRFGNFVIFNELAERVKQLEEAAAQMESNAAWEREYSRLNSPQRHEMGQ